MTSIVKTKNNNYFIAKKVPLNDEMTMHEVLLFNQDLSHEKSFTSQHNCSSRNNWRIKMGIYNRVILRRRWSLISFTKTDKRKEVNKWGNNLSLATSNSFGNGIFASS